MVGSIRSLQASAELAQVSRSDQDQPECQEFSAVPLSMKWRSVKMRDQQRVAQLAMQGPGHCLLSPLKLSPRTPFESHLYILSPNITCPSTGLTSSKHHVSLPWQNTILVCITWHNQKLSLQPDSKFKGYAIKSLIHPGSRHHVPLTNNQFWRWACDHVAQWVQQLIAYQVQDPRFWPKENQK